MGRILACRAAAVLGRLMSRRMRTRWDQWPRARWVLGLAVAVMPGVSLAQVSSGKSGSAPNAQQQAAQSTARGTACRADETSRQPVVEIHHRELQHGAYCTLRLTSRRTVLVHVVDANPLIYEYQLAATPVAADPAVAAFRALFAVRDVPPAAAVARDLQQVVAGTTENKAARQTVAAQTLASEVLQVADVLSDLLVESDWVDTRRTAADVQASLDLQLTAVLVATQELRNYLYSDQALIARLDALWAAVPIGERAPLEPIMTAARVAAPGVVTLSSQLRALALGTTWLSYEATGEGEHVIELAITNRLGSAYLPRRATGTGFDVAALRPATPRYLFSVGLGGLFGDRRTYALEEVPATTPSEGEPTPPQEYTVREAMAKRVSIVPTALLTLQFTPSRRYPDLVVGPSIGVGVRGDALEQIDAATDLMGLLTAGWDWARVSLGAAYTSEITDLDGLADGDRTTDPNALTRATRDRKWRMVLSFHAAP
jgi:hypothetical protein